MVTISETAVAIAGNILGKIFSFIEANKEGFLFIVFILIMVTSFFLNISAMFSLLLGLLFIFFVFKFQWSIWFLSAFIPIKAFLRIGDVFPHYFITLIIPITLIGFYLGYKLSAGNKDDKVTNTDMYLFFIFLASIFSSFGFIYNYGFRAHQLLDFFIWLQLIGFYLMGKLSFRKTSLNNFLLFNLIIANFVSVYSVIQYFFISSSYWIESYEIIRTRVFGTLGNPNALAGYLLMVISMGFLFFYSNQGLKKRLIFFPLPLIAILLTFSRSVWLVGVLGFFLFLLYTRSYKLMIISLALSLILFSIAPDAIKARIKNIASSQHLSYSADSGRVWAFRNILHINRSKPVFGNGWGSYGGEYAYSNASPVYLESIQDGTVGVANTDNQWLQVYAQQGVMGLLLYFLMFRDFFYKNKNILAISLSMFLLLGVFIDVFQFYQIAFWGWLVLGILSVDKLREGGVQR